MTSARFSRADIREILNTTTIGDILPCGYNDLRAVRYRDIRENAECGFPFAALSLRNRCAPGGALSHPSRAEYFVVVFQEPSLAETAGEKEGSDVAEHVAPGIGNHIEQPGSVAEARDRPFVALFRISRVPDPYFAVALRVSGCLLRIRRSPLCLSFLSEVGFL